MGRGRGHAQEVGPPAAPPALRRRGGASGLRPRPQAALPGLLAASHPPPCLQRHQGSVCSSLFSSVKWERLSHFHTRGRVTSATLRGRRAWLGGERLLQKDRVPQRSCDCSRRLRGPFAGSTSSQGSAWQGRSESTLKPFRTTVRTTSWLCPKSEPHLMCLHLKTSPLSRVVLCVVLREETSTCPALIGSRKRMSRWEIKQATQSRGQPPILRPRYASPSRTGASFGVLLCFPVSCLW